MPTNLITATYLIAAIFFIWSLGGLSSNVGARKGLWFGITGMVLAVSVTILNTDVVNYVLIAITMAIGSAIGLILATRVQMVQMPQLVAILHSLVGLAAVLIGYGGYMDDSLQLTGVEKTIHDIEVYIGIYIGAFTFSGSVMAFGKLSTLLNAKPVLLPARHYLNLLMFITVIIFGWIFVTPSTPEMAYIALYIMTALGIIFGIHMVLAIGGADMPVVISMLNSYSGWAAAATGFMLSNDLLIIVGALVGSSGAILSYIMCKAMNRNFFSVISGGFGTLTKTTASTSGEQIEVSNIDVAQTATLLLQAKKIVIVPGYGMAVAQAQHAVSGVTQLLMSQGVNVRFGIHPVAGRMPGHMNVLLAEAKIPYDAVFEMEQINPDFGNVDVSIVIGANDTVNPSALTDPDSPIAGMPVLEVWRGKTTIVLKRSMAQGYSGVENPLFGKENTRMLFGDAKTTMDALLLKLS
ncbi:MAG: NAD(P)(+) transhydrogenase (Re/Si-specific) subunit beta [Candidatus Thiodubiliella endoseptemdiera]|uniref:NAD(P) transhydrogenase subunit beta n=1 Tax=Candidatus Thiodubiliella endoseptemdiera TaxID=2738886 RepID=A0A853F1N5_9GAMM|nr:NAD(P)(+) transhydrogenase (Re/Si-specific) subunit beta [Candidatus Thiodubiliella endoseptemdiera]